MREFHEWARHNQWILFSPLILLLLYNLIKWKINENRKNREKLSESFKKGEKFIDPRGRKIEYFVDESPSAAIRFGSKATWLAIKATNHDEISNEFRQQNKKAFKTNLENGIYGAYASNIFVLPKISEWIIVIHPELTIDNDKGMNRLVGLSEKYGEVQFFGSFRGVGYSSWAKFVNGDIIRAYCVADGEVYQDIGKLTQIEQEFIEKAIEKATDEEELDWIKGDGKLLSMSSEENVFEIAEKWSINPDKIENYEVDGLGTIIEM